MKLINVDEFIQRLADFGYGTDYEGESYFAYMSGADTIIGLLNEAPTVDPASLVKRGRWTFDEVEMEYYCSVCGHNAPIGISSYILHNYCSNCGAKMEE